MHAKDYMTSKCTVSSRDKADRYTIQQTLTIGRIVDKCNKYLFEIEKQPARLVKISRVKKYIYDNRPRPIDESLKYLEDNYKDMVEYLRKTR